MLIRGKGERGLEGEDGKAQSDHKNDTNTSLDTLDWCNESYLQRCDAVLLKYIQY